MVTPARGGAPKSASLASEPVVCFHGGAFFSAIGDGLDHLERRREIINADVLDAWFPPAPAVLATLHEHLPWLLRTSPPADAAGLVRAIAQARGVPEECVLAGAGSSSLIFLALRHWLAPSSRVLLLDPMYGEYAHVCEQVLGCRVDRFILPRVNDYRFNPDVWLDQVRHGYDLVVLVNPNNPTGMHVERDLLEAALREVPTSTIVWLDEAYLDYVGAAQSLERFAVARPNVVVCKSLSKVYALSGVRAAYLCGSTGLLDPLRVLTPPWAVSLLAQVAAVRALRENAYYARCHQETHALRRRLADGLKAAIPELEVVEGVANFILCFLPPIGPDAATLIQRCQPKGLFLRDVRNMGTRFGSGAFRVAVKDVETQARILEIIGHLWSGERRA